MKTNWETVSEQVSFALKHSQLNLTDEEIQDILNEEKWEKFREIQDARFDALRKDGCYEDEN